MKMFASRSWLMGIGIAVFLASALYLGVSRGLGERHSDPATSPQGNLPAERCVVCFGYVDVEQGIIHLRPTQAGRVVAVPVAENQRVQADTVLLWLDDVPAKCQVEEARADLKVAEAQLTQVKALPEQHQARLAMQRDAIAAAQSRLSAARQVLLRKQHLEQSKLASAEDVRIAADQVRELEAAARIEQHKLRDMELQDPTTQLATAEGNVQVRKARLEQSLHRLAECELRAPAAGHVLRVQAAPGDLVGEPGKVAVIDFCPDQPRIIRTEVPQGFVGLLKPGQPVMIQDDVHSAETWRGKVTRISDWYTQRRSVLQEPLQRNDVRTVECIVTIDSDQPPVRIGQRMLVTLNCGSPPGK